MRDAGKDPRVGARNSREQKLPSEGVVERYPVFLEGPPGGGETGTRVYESESGR